MAGRRPRADAQAVVVGLALALILVGCKVPVDAPAPTSPAPSSAAQVRFAAVGDSLTAGTVMPGVLVDPPAEVSWVYYADASDSAIFVGGWAHAGSTSTMQAANVTPVDADVLIIESGTNDVLQGIDFAQQTADMDAIASTIRAPSVLVLAIPPLESLADSGAVTTTNVELEQLAFARGWDFLDPWKAYRLGERWSPGTSDDGIHPTLIVHRSVGGTIARFLDEHYRKPATSRAE
ncbi:SGNH/GDSL hydrolase family protein [Naasia lichenicola]|uniref:SGNH/GDSL hydrolase family protein n=1 Tax=Naasia lichenicola TaxID=2565933 RepID=A0A4S4FKW8_9MICO|nr:SGNH/GDSL hydrolase family protein [Naasia lichenicola]THG30811.1 SGNH/GDSL hydrolase family protein [Naasia lichenicola]